MQNLDHPREKVINPLNFNSLFVELLLISRTGALSIMKSLLIGLCILAGILVGWLHLWKWTNLFFIFLFKNCFMFTVL